MPNESISNNHNRTRLSRKSSNAGSDHGEASRLTVQDLLRLPIKKRSLTWQEGQAKSVTLVVTENCQLRCRYCYVLHKNSRKRMSFDVARRTIDYLIEQRQLFTDKALILEYIGGEPLLEIDLIDQISDYLKIQLYQHDHPWFDNYRFSISTNGLLYDDPRVQRYIRKNATHLSLGITIDGTPRKHDLQRVYPNGKGSYADVIRNVPLWLKQFPGASTKVTVASEDIPYTCESVLHLFSLGIREVNINVVFEDVWKEGDDVEFEKQLIALADAIVDQQLYRDHVCSFFNEHIGFPIDKAREQNWCGSGRNMIAVDTKGVFYPCNRFLPFTLSNKTPRVIGNCYDGIDMNKLRPFYALNRSCQSLPECMECEVASGCAWCVGHNYDTADTDTVFQRATSICKMHKARVRANQYYRKRLVEKVGDGRTGVKNVRSGV